MQKTLLLVILIVSTFSSAQNTGITLFLDMVEGRPHIQIVDIKEAKDKSIYLLGECKDQKFKETSSWSMHIDSQGGTIRANYEKEKVDVNDLKRLILSDIDNGLFVGNKNSDGGKLQSFTRLYDKNGAVKMISVMALSYPIILGDAINYDKNTVLIAQSNRKVTNNKFNITVLKAPIDHYLPIEIGVIPSDFNEVPTQIALNSKKEMIISCVRYLGKTMSNIIYCTNENGEKLWEFEPKVDASFINSYLTVDKKDNIVFACSYRNSTSNLSSSVVLKLNQKGGFIKQDTIENIKSNGILTLSNGNYLLYGANFQPYDNRIVISRGAYRIMDSNLKIIKSEEFTPADIPGTKMESKAFDSNPISSEINNGIQLSDSRIIFGGRINFPLHFGSENEVTSDRANKAFVLFTTSDGKFRKK